MEEFSRNVLVRVLKLKRHKSSSKAIYKHDVWHFNFGTSTFFVLVFSIQFFPFAASNNDCSHYRAVIAFTRIRNLQNNYVIRPCETVADVAAGCSLDPIEFILEEVRPSGIYQINTVNAEAINNDAEIVP